MSDPHCDEVFAGSTPVVRELETDAVLAFRHTRPAYPVHIVVVPKRHIPSLLDLDDEELALELLAAVRLVASQVPAQHGAARIITNLGEYQDSQHLHWHVVAGAQFA